MKRIISSLLFVIVILSVCVFPVSAKNDAIVSDPNVEITYLENGGYIVTQRVITSIKYDSSKEFYSSDLMVGTLSLPYYVYGYSVLSYFDIWGRHCWDFVLNGTFYVNPGVSSTCTDAFYQTYIYYSSWSFSNGSILRVGNTAYGSGKFTYFIQHILVDESLSCDVNGNLY